MQNSFRPIALRLSLCDVAALAAATARLFDRRGRERPLAFAFRFRLSAVLTGPHPGSTMAAGLPA